MNILLRWCRHWARVIFLVTLVGAAVFWPAVGSATLIDDLNSNNEVVADAAYVALFAMEAAAIDPLLANTGQTGAYAGSAWVNEESSVALFEHESPPSRGVVSLYLVEAILRNRLAPHLLPEFSDAVITDQSVLFSLANASYQSWWSVHQGESISQLRSGPQPLDPPSTVVWY
jgi:hypothetical protein